MASGADSEPSASTTQGPWTEDPEFVRIYDLENQGLEDVGFYLELVRELGAARVADVGCGTGVLAVELARRGVQVEGVDPADAMLEVARERVAAAEVSSLVGLTQGTAAELASSSADAALMVGHVAQYFLQRADWQHALTECFRALVPGGRLAFESQNPSAVDLELWSEENTRETSPHPEGGEMTSWLEVTGVVTDDDGELITCRAHHLTADGRHLTAEETLRYRPWEILESSLREAGFEVESVWGDWDRSPLEEDSPEIIVVARKPK
ncbi:class I SAM-dependent methyltransferase [Nesterenkonia flava]